MDKACIADIHAGNLTLLSNSKDGKTNRQHRPNLTLNHLEMEGRLSDVGWCCKATHG